MTDIMKETYTRGALAVECGVNLETIRYYEKQGLMPDPPRTAAGYRCYSHDHLKRLKFIQWSKELGFSNAQIADLLVMVDGGYSCDEVQRVALANARVIASKIADLSKMKQELELMAAKCSGGPTPNCAIIDRLLEE